VEQGKEARILKRKRMSTAYYQWWECPQRCGKDYVHIGSCFDGTKALSRYYQVVEKKCEEYL
jgi:hypothetical protein